VLALFNLHKVPQISMRIERQNHRNIQVVINDYVFNLANTFDTNKIVHYLNFLFDILEEVLFTDLFDAHVLQAIEEVVTFILAEAADTDHA
jgi:hypothetical protein